MKKIIIAITLILICCQSDSKSVLDESDEYRIASVLKTELLNTDILIPLNVSTNLSNDIFRTENISQSKVEILSMDYVKKDLLQSIIGLEILIALFIFLKLSFEFIRSNQAVYSKE